LRRSHVKHITLTIEYSLFIHIMPCVTLHCLLHLTPPDVQATRYPAVYHIKHAPEGSSFHYSLSDMLLWSSVPYALWQATYYFFITLRRRDKIAAGRLTSFVWLRRSYKGTLLGKIVNSQPEWLQEPMFMLIQYSYAMLTMLPCPIWFWYRWWSAGFLCTVFAWSVYNGATYYIDIFGRRFEKELEQLKKDVARLQSSPDANSMKTPLMTPDDREKEKDPGMTNADNGHERSKSSGSEVDNIPLLDESARDSVGNNGSTGPEDKKNA
jgi:hypothetical protein